MARDDGPLIISGPSGVGKTSVARALSGGSERFALAVTSTTRAARPGELDGRDYHFLSVEEFDRLVKNDGFIEHVSARGAQYGLTKAELERIWKDGRVPILVLDPDGMDAVKALYPQALSVFIDAPSAVVTERLLARGDTDVASRMRDNLKVWAARGGYDVVIGNESDLAACVDGVRRAFEDRFDTAYNARELEARQKGGTPMKGVLIPTDGAPRPIDIQRACITARRTAPSMPLRAWRRLGTSPSSTTTTRSRRASFTPSSSVTSWPSAMTQRPARTATLLTASLRP